MARPRKYATDAERQAANAQRQQAFRARSEIVDRAGLEALRALLEAFQEATRSAARAGDETAGAVLGATAEGTLKRLCERWQAVADQNTPADVDGPETGAERELRGPYSSE